jgi:hypothetical protein
MAKPAPRWVQNTLAFIFPIAGGFFIAERKDRDRYNLAKTIMVNDVKADWNRIGKKGNPFTTTDISVNDFMETALGGRAVYWADRLKAANKEGEKRVAARHLAVVDELTRNFVPVEPPQREKKQTGDLVVTGGQDNWNSSPSTSGSGSTGSGFTLLPDGTITATPQTQMPSNSKPWYMDLKIMIPVYLGAAALFYLFTKKR